MNCPNCSSSSVAEILWGLDVELWDLKKLLDEKKIVLGGCLISSHDPKWECNECHKRWGEAEHNDENGSFDYEQGFNISEVYDQ